MKAAIKGHPSLRQMLGVARSALYRYPIPSHAPEDTAIVLFLYQLIVQYPTYRYRRLWARLFFGESLAITIRNVPRLMKMHGWQVVQLQTTPRPRVVKRRSVAAHSDELWALDATYIDCGSVG